MSTALHSTRVITPTGVIEATLVIADGKISEVLPGQVERDGIPFESVGDQVFMPGVIVTSVPFQLASAEPLSLPRVGSGSDDVAR